MSMQTLLGLATVIVVSGTLTAATSAHSPAHAPQPAGGSAGAQEPPVRITMEELHRHGGVPPGWRFTIPPGDPKAGRDVFAKLECNKCHAVANDFPAPPKEAGNAGPELTGMGGHHPPEYMAQSILAPNAVIVTGPGHTGPDGLSIMPSYTDILTVPELLDLVAYLGSLTDGDDTHEHHAGGGTPEQVAGEYRIRIAYHSHAESRPGAHAHGTQGHGAPAPPAHGAQRQPAHGAHDKPAHGGAGHHRHGAKGQGHTPPAKAPDHLMVFVTDARTGEPVPYLPVTVTLQADGATSRTVKLGPMVGGQGFHYGADLTVPASTTKLTVAIGPTTMRVMPSAAGRYGGTARVTFDWPR